MRILKKAAAAALALLLALFLCAPAFAAAPPEITRHPLDVNVSEGGSAEFSAEAEGWVWCAWRFLSPDGKETLVFDTVRARFPTLTVSGGNETVLRLENVPLAMNGWKAVCLFSANGGQWSFTDEAVITVNPAGATPPPVTAAAAPEEKEASTPEPEPASSPAPTPEPAPPADPEPEPESAPEPGPSRPNARAWIVPVLCVTAAGTSLFLLKKKKRPAEPAAPAAFPDEGSKEPGREDPADENDVP